MIYDIACKRAALEEINLRHKVSRAYFFGEADFREDFKVEVQVGLCAGLVQVWWAELRKGNDAIRCIQRATPSLIRDVLLSQALSFYFKELPADTGKLLDPEIALLTFKYGDYRVGKINALQTLFGVENSLELDLVLHHGVPILRRWQLSHVAADIVDVLSQSGSPGLYLFVARFWDSKRATRERGHRSALVVEVGGSCRFYDPRWGEIAFTSISHFTPWFMEYWTLERWDHFLKRRVRSSPPLQIFNFGGKFSRAAMKKNLALQNRYSASTLSLQDLQMMLANHPIK